MPKLRALAKVDAGFALTGPNQRTIRQPINAPAAAVFSWLEDGPAWGEWLGIDVEWTSPKPFGVGTTRTVIAKGLVIEEYFLAWEQDRQMGFRFDRVNLPAIAAMSEDWTIEPIDDVRCELQWSFAVEGRGRPGELMAKALAAGVGANGKRALVTFAGLVEARPNRFQ